MQARPVNLDNDGHGAGEYAELAGSAYDRSAQKLIAYVCIFSCKRYSVVNI